MGLWRTKLRFDVGDATNSWSEAIRLAMSGEFRMMYDMYRYTNSMWLAPLIDELGFRLDGNTAFEWLTVFADRAVTLEDAYGSLLREMDLINPFRIGMSNVLAWMVQNGELPLVGESLDVVRRFFGGYPTMSPVIRVVV